MQNIIAPCIVFVLSLAVGSDAGLQFSAEMGKGFTIGWELDGEDIILEASAPTPGWIGIGFSETKTMQKADLIIMGVLDGKPYVWDAYSPMTGVVQIDQKQNVTIIEGVENETSTYMKIRRTLKAGDKERDNNIKKGDNNFLWAFGDQDKTADSSRNDYHWNNRGYYLLNTMNSQKETVTDAASTTLSTTPVSKASAEKVFQFQTNQEFPYDAFLDLENTVHLKWNFDDEYITLQMIAPTTGYIGVGFSHTGSMFGADLIMMGVTDNRSYVKDCHAEKNGVPNVDEQQDIKIIGSWENGTHTMVTITRKRVTCDDDDMMIEEGTYRIIWAYGSSDIGMTPDGSHYHMRNRGSKSIKLINAHTQLDVKDMPEEEYKHFDVGPSNFKVPARDTFYLCKIIEIPQEPEKQHVIGFDIVITPGNEKYLHHLIVYLCEDKKDSTNVGEDVECFIESNPFQTGCFKMFAGWAVGMSNVRFPINAGFPIGGKNSPKYVMLEAHYDNPEIRSDIIDSSVARFYYTDNLREHDVGIITVSQAIRGIWIPPNAERFTINGQCPNECLSQGFDGADFEESTIISTLLHAHLAGRAMKLRHFRNRKEITPVAKDDHYDFDYQENQYMEDEKVKIRKGDAFAMECKYDTLGKKNITTGGLGTRNEMCSAFVFHYPALKLDSCDSRVPIMETEEAFVNLVWGLGASVTEEEGVEIDLKIRRAPLQAMDILAEVLKDVEWTDEKRKFAEDYMEKSKKRPFCTYRKRMLLNMWQDITIPEYTPFKEKSLCGHDKMIQNSTSDEIVALSIGSSSATFAVLGAALILIMFMAAKYAL